GTYRQTAAGYHTMVQVGTAGLGGVAYIEAHPGAGQIAAVADLPAGFGVEGGLIQHHHTLFALSQTVYRLTIAEQRNDLRGAAGAGVALEPGVGIDLDQLVVIQPELTRSPGTLALGLHGGFKAGFIDGQPALAGDVPGQVHREAVGVVQLEDDVPGQVHREAVGVVQLEDDVPGNLAALELGQILLEDAQALLQGTGELLFLGLEHPLDMRLLRLQLGEGLAHLRDQRRHYAVEE